MRIVRCAAALGCRAHGVDPVRAGAAEAEGLRRAVLEHKLLIVRPPEPEAMTQASFLSFFRAVTGRNPEKQTGRDHAQGEHAEVFIISNRAEDARFDRKEDSSPFLSARPLGWHSDLSYRRRPGSFTLLRAEQLPAGGGATRFADLSAALRGLPAATRAALNGLRARHAHPEPHMNAVEPDPVHHPVVRRHGDTGVEALYVNEMFTREIAGAPDGLLAELLQHIAKPEFRYEHQWELGDLVLWDNRATMHARGEFSGARSLWRTHALGEEPVAASAA